MITVYGVHRSRASRNIWLLHELSIPFELKPVIQAYRLLERPPGLPPMNTRSPEFLRLNGLGQIPVVVDDGLVLTESLAIHREAGNPRAEGGDLGTLANLLKNTGRFEEAERAYARALELLRAAGARRDRRPCGHGWG